MLAWIRGGPRKPRSTRGWQIAREDAYAAVVTVEMGEHAEVWRRACGVIHEICGPGTDFTLTKI